MIELYIRATMSSWATAFIIMCIMLGPIVVIGGLMGFFMLKAPGTRELLSSTEYGLGMSLLIAPFIFVGYKAYYAEDNKPYRAVGAGDVDY